MQRVIILIMMRKIHALIESVSCCCNETPEASCFIKISLLHSVLGSHEGLLAISHDGRWHCGSGGVQQGGITWQDRKPVSRKGLVLLTRTYSASHRNYCGGRTRTRGWHIKTSMCRKSLCRGQLKVFCPLSFIWWIQHGREKPRKEKLELGTM